MSWNSLKCNLQAKNECREIELKRKPSLRKQTPPPNTFADSRPISACYFIFRSPPVEIFAQYSLHTNLRVPNIQPSYHFVGFLLTVDVVWLILSCWGEPKECKPQAKKLGLNWSGHGGPFTTLKKAKRSETERCGALWLNQYNCSSYFEQHFLCWLNGYLP